MPNPYLPLWEYIPNVEPRVFGDRVYIYGSHDNAGSDKFCDSKLKVWSAPLDDLNNWTCHGDIFHTKDDRDHKSDTSWTNCDLYAPDVVEKDGRYYLYAYILGAKGCVASSDTPEGPFKLLSRYKYNENEGSDGFKSGLFIDPGVLVDDDGRVYIYCGYERSFAAEIDPDNMYEIINGSFKEDIIPQSEPFSYFEACSPRKIGNTYYIIYSPRNGSRLAYATSDSPLGPFVYRGVIVDNGIDYPAGNNHGSICCINGQWYVFYQRMTNGTLTSRRACAERIEILPDGSIPQAEMTSLGFEKALSPYKITPADIACVLKGGCIITEHSVFSRPVTAITDGCIIGYKYFDFGSDNSSKTMEFSAKVRGCGCRAIMTVMIDGTDNGIVLGECEIGASDGIYNAILKSVNGVHSVYFGITDTFGGWFRDMAKNRHLFELEEFVFMK